MVLPVPISSDDLAKVFHELAGELQGAMRTQMQIAAISSVTAHEDDCGFPLAIRALLGAVLVRSQHFSLPSPLFQVVVELESPA
jgi:hypothetical protein